jgi:hypothetical protein
VLDVPARLTSVTNSTVYSQLQYRRAGVVDASGRDLLFDLYVWKV